MNSKTVVIPVIDDYSKLSTGDMPGDKVQIDDDKVIKAQKILPNLLGKIKSIQGRDKIVISLHGGSGVGKSEISSVLRFYLEANGYRAYILSGDNYPHRIPKLNDLERIRYFREEGLKGLIKTDTYTQELNEKILKLQEEEEESNPKQCQDLPGLEVYQEYGRKGLADYLGSSKEIDYCEINRVVKQFRKGDTSIYLKRMGRSEQDIWYDKVDFSATQILIIEWTHGNNPELEGVDIPILLNSTPEETLEHRKNRNRDGNTDSPFTTMVLEIEQAKLQEQSKTAKIIVMKNGDVIDE